VNLKPVTTHRNLHSGHCVVSFIEMHGFYYELQATLSAILFVIASQLIKPLRFGRFTV
jgi:hypothetical protein